MTNETNENIILENMVETEVELANPPTDDSSISVLADPDPEDTIEAYLSTYEIGRGWDMEDKLEYSLRDIESAVATLQVDKADATHTHNGYASSDDLQVLVDAIDTKANAAHSHTEYSSVNHTHNGYATQTAFDTLESEVDEKANVNHTHTEYATVSHSHEEYADSNHVHTGVYDVSGSANSALISAKAYADELIADEVVNRNSAIATAKSSVISTAASDATTKANNALASAKTYADNAAATVKNDLLNNAGAAYDTLKELGDLIEDNTDAIEALETVASGKANAVHTHSVSDITNLQSALDGKASTNHGTHVSYSTTAPVMDGTASVGSASTVARSDHKHPTDTSRAAQTSLDSHTSNKSNPHNVTLSQLGLTVTAAELNKLDGVTATTAELNILDGVTTTTTELNYVDGVTSNIQTQLNSKASSSHTHSNASTSAAGLMSANDKAKLDGIASGANAYTLPTASSTLGGVKTTSTVTNASGYTACPIISGVPYYKDTNTTYSLSSFGVTATAAELNYVDGVTSNIQTQLNGKAASGHNHSGVYANASHTHTASDVGAVATGDIATVSEVETYLGI